MTLKLKLWEVAPIYELKSGYLGMDYFSEPNDALGDAFLLYQSFFAVWRERFFLFQK